MHGQQNIKIGTHSYRSVLKRELKLCSAGFLAQQASDFVCKRPVSSAVPRQSAYIRKQVKLLTQSKLPRRSSTVHEMPPKPQHRAH